MNSYSGYNLHILGDCYIRYIPYIGYQFDGWEKENRSI
jgi:hypothetical protein